MVVVSLVTQYRKLRWNLVRIFTILAPVEVPHALAPQYFQPAEDRDKAP